MTDRPTGSYTHERLIALEDSHKDLVETLHAICQEAISNKWEVDIDLWLFVHARKAVDDGLQIMKEAGRI